MKRISCLVVLLCATLCAQPAQAQGLLGGLLSDVTSTVGGLLSPPIGVIVRTNLGLAGLKRECLLNGCTVTQTLDGSEGQLFLVQPQQGLLPDLLASVLRLVNGILDAEPDQLVIIPPNTGTGAPQTTIPNDLYDQTPVNYFGSTVWDGYVTQPAALIIQVGQAQSTFDVTGNVIVADIDTGVDPNHPALKPFLLQGYNFITNEPGASEMTDLNGATGSACSTCQAAFVDQHTAAMLDQHTAAMLDGNQYADFGHGTEVSAWFTWSRQPRASCR